MYYFGPCLFIAIFGHAHIRRASCKSLEIFELLCSKSCVSVFRVLSATKYYNQHQRFQPYPPFNPHHRSSLPTSDTNSNTGSRFGRDLGVRGPQMGPCFKISVNLLLLLFLTA